MLLVIFIHVLSEWLLLYVRHYPQYALMLSLHRMSSFAVQGFIFLSGLKLFLKKDGEFRLGKFYLGRFLRVVVPYLIAFAIFYVYFIIKGYITPSASGFITSFLSGGLVNHFYFVAIIVQFYLLMPLWRLIVRKASPLITLTLSLILMMILRVYLPEITKLIFGSEFKYNARLFTTYLFYFLAGAFAGDNYEKFKEFLAARKRGIYITFAVTAVIDCFAIWSIETGFAWLSWADMFHVIYCVTAILALMCFAVKITGKESVVTRTAPILEAASYNVYLIHPLFIYFSQAICSRIGLESLTLRLVFRFFFTFVLSIGLCVAWEAVKRRIRAKKAPAN